MGWKEKRFGLLEVLCEKQSNIFLCRCKCGKEVMLWRSQLENDVLRHCGCRKPYIRMVPDENGHMRRRSVPCETVHFRRYYSKSGKEIKIMSGELYTYLGMICRCYVKNCTGYPDYGGRGITVCDRWLLPTRHIGFMNFLADLGPRGVGLTLDRINFNGHYEPGNCRWATVDEQVRNRRPQGSGDLVSMIEDYEDMNERVEQTYDLEPEAIY